MINKYQIAFFHFVNLIDASGHRLWISYQFCANQVGHPFHRYRCGKLHIDLLFTKVLRFAINSVCGGEMLRCSAAQLFNDCTPSILFSNACHAGKKTPSALNVYFKNFMGQVIKMSAIFFERWHVNFSLIHKRNKNVDKIVINIFSVSENYF
jgi:hypothetical protein